ncbi:hypothetical protein ACA910_015942 [Epithemia clementina (nom. ined.)]
MPPPATTSSSNSNNNIKSHHSRRPYQATWHGGNALSNWQSPHNYGGVILVVMGFSILVMAFVNLWMASYHIQITTSGTVTTSSLLQKHDGQSSQSGDDDKRMPTIRTSRMSSSFGALEQPSAQQDATITTTQVHKQVQAPHSLPPLSSLVQGFEVQPGQDVSWLLDFAIVGFPKCGTTSIMYQLQSHPQVDMFSDERCDLSYNKQALLVRDLYQSFVVPDDNNNNNNSETSTTTDTSAATLAPFRPNSNKNIDTEDSYRSRWRGLKCPADLESTPMSLPRYQEYFPHTKFIVGIRHPILWFESFYNFRLHNGFKMPPPEQLIGRCHKGMYNCCTFRSNFHIFLANLGKTKTHTPASHIADKTSNQKKKKKKNNDPNALMLDPEELQWMAPELQRSVKPQPGHLHRPVFLYDVSQLRNDNPQRSKQFLGDLQQFLGLSQPFYATEGEHDSSSIINGNDNGKDNDNNNNNLTAKILWYKPGKKPEERAADPRQAHLDAQKIDICESPRFDHLRKVLIAQAQNASHWIVHYFLQHAPNVTVSSPNHLIDTILNQEWKQDPCHERRRRQQQEQ